MHSFCTASVTIAVFSSAVFAQCDGQWLPGRGTRGVSSEVLSQVVFPGGDVLLAGSFANAGGVPAYYLARYNPVTSAWSTLQGGAGAPGNPPHVMLLLPNGDLLVGGPAGSPAARPTSTETGMSAPTPTSGSSPVGPAARAVS
jgi:hypothetical protein